MLFSLPFRARAAAPQISPVIVPRRTPAPARPRRTAAPATTRLVIMLRCSAGPDGQWQTLARAMDDRYVALAPDLAAPDADAELPRLADDVAALREFADRHGEAFHLVGHSHGGAVALRAALDMPERIASLTLIEPVAFHLLRPFAPLWLEVRALAQALGDAVRAGTPAEGMARFVDYWNGEGTWASLAEGHRARLAASAARTVRDFAAVFAETADLRDYARLTMPTQLICGETTTAPCRKLVDQLSVVLPRLRRDVIAGAGHMAPLSHAEATNRLILEHLRAVTEGPAAQPPIDGKAALRRYS
jgi:pimeloyl-ACP methyl ester carboxylesterase